LNLLLSLRHHQPVGELLIRGRGDGGLLPQIGGQDLVGVLQGSEASLHEITFGLGVTGRASEAIRDTSESHKLLSGGGTDNTGTTGGRNQSDGDGTTFTGDLHGDGMGETELGAPVTTTDGDQVDLGGDQTTTDGEGNLLGGLDTEADVTRAITNADEGLESVALTGGGLLLDGHDLHDVILEDVATESGETAATILVLAEEFVNDLVLLDGKRVKVDVLDGGDLLVLHETAELGAGNPGFFTAFLVLALAFLAALLAAFLATFAEASVEAFTFTFGSAHD